MASNLEILAYEETPLGILCLRRRELLSMPGKIVTEITLDNAFLMSSLHTDSERALASVAAEMHGGSDLRILVGGLGLGYTVDAILGFDQVRSVEVIEFLPQVISWLEDGLVPLSEKLNGDERLKIVEGDCFARMWETPTGLYDLILIDIDHSPDDRLGSVDQRFYSEEGLKHARGHLVQGGILGIWSYEESSPLSEALEATFGEVRIEPVTHENILIDETHTDWLFFARG